VEENTREKNRLNTCSDTLLFFTDIGPGTEAESNPVLRALAACTRIRRPDAREKEHEPDRNPICDQLEKNTRTNNRSGPQGTRNPTSNNYSTTRQEPTHRAAAQPAEADPHEDSDWIAVLSKRKLHPELAHTKANQNKHQGRMNAYSHKTFDHR